ncbi:MAG TPA: carboxypeptidase-like regulatory domain-containing protein, partial [Flavitalea sp.]|nr:carboxypeptidase-like regulatory domain-containing protein [Flavitalea sp.]
MYIKYTALFGRPYHPFLKFIIVMKLTTVLILGGLLQVSAAGFSQHLTYHKKQASLEQIFREIRKQTGYTVLWSTSKIRNASPTDADFEKTPLQTVLSGLLPALDLSFEINENAILIKEKVLLPVKTAIEIADIPVKGRVVDEENQPLAGVTVSIKGTEKATTSNLDGSFIINAPENATLVFSFVGTIAQEIPIRNRSSITVKLENDQKNLEIVDVVAVGYGTQKKSEVTGASSTVTATEIAKRPLQRVEQALQGTTSGVVVQSKSGQPGNSLSVKIRGSNSITGSNEPLYVIDGYIGGNIETVNPND